MACLHSSYLKFFFILLIYYPKHASFKYFHVIFHLSLCCIYSLALLVEICFLLIILFSFNYFPQKILMIFHLRVFFLKLWEHSSRWCLTHSLCPHYLSCSVGSRRILCILTSLRAKFYLNHTSSTINILSGMTLKQFLKNLFHRL